MSQSERYHQMIGASKALTLNIQTLRKALSRRGPWRRGSLRDYHDALLYELATSKRSRIKLRALRTI
jgi:hypothetical protein